MDYSTERQISDGWYTAGVFTLFVAVGCGFIIAAKLNHYTAFTVTGLPVAIMLTYAILVKAVRLLRVRDDQAGDNLYYMGFLFTLTSLGVSLYQFRADGAAEEIVQNFGVAIGSTIAGVALRVVFNQMRRDPIEVEHAARLGLAEAARKVRRELDNTVVELSHFRRSSQQSISEGFEEVRHEMEKVSGRILGNFEDMITRAGKPFETVSENSNSAMVSLGQTLTGSLQSTANHLADENQKLAVAAAHIKTQLEATTEKLAAMQTPQNVIEVKIEPIISSLTNAINELGQLIQKQTENEAQTRADNRASQEEIRVNSIAIREIAHAISASTTIIRDSVGQFGSNEKQIAPLVEAIAEATRKQDEDRALFQGIGNRIEALFKIVMQRFAAAPNE